MYSLNHLTRADIAVRCESRAEAKLFCDIADRLYYCGDISYQFDVGETCFDIIDEMLGSDTELSYLQDGFQIISLRELFISLCDGNLDIDLFNGNSVAIQFDTVEEENSIIDMYHDAILGRRDRGWEKRETESVVNYADEPTCFTIGVSGARISYCRRGYYEDLGYVIFTYSELFGDINLSCNDDPTLDFLLS